MTRVALLAWGSLFDEDFLDPLGVSLDDLRHRFVGSWIFGYTSALGRAGCSVHVVLPASCRRPVRFTHLPTGCSVCLLPASRAYRAARRRSAAAGAGRGGLARRAAPWLATPWLRLARELRRERCRALICQSHDDARFDGSVLLGRLLGIPVFSSFQGGGDRPLEGLERRLRPVTLRLARGFLCGCRDEGRRLRVRAAIPAGRVVHVGNPVDLAVWTPGGRPAARQRLGIPPDARVAVWHGRIDVAKKGLDLLLGAWDRIVAERPGRDLRLLLVGDGPDAAHLRRHLRTAPVRGLTWVDRFVHDRVDLGDRLRAADVYVFPSRYEGVPVAPLEAMACGLAVVAAAAHGVPDLLPGGEADGGEVVAPADPELSLRRSGTCSTTRCGRTS